ncbi:MAG: hypothetical protein OEM97_08650 [Acidimicrobiia bacterium]|nr:hypothetical protein [Acidimicrobiia bacterium]
MHAEGRSGRADHDALEVIAALLLGLAAVAIAWSAYQASLWGGIQDTALAESVLLSNRAVDEFQLADTTLAFDQALFVNLVVLLTESGVTAEEFDGFVNDGLGGFILDNMSEQADVATTDWFLNDLPLPFDDTYQDVLYAEANRLADESSVSFETASGANRHSDDWVLASTILAAVLFLAGISTALRSRGTRKILMAGSTILFLGSIAFMLTLPNALSA